MTFYKAVNLVRFSYSHQIMNLFVIDVWVRNGCHHLVNFIFVNNVIINLWCPHPFKLGFINFFAFGGPINRTREVGEKERKRIPFRLSRQSYKFLRPSQIKNLNEQKLYAEFFMT